MTDHDDPTCGGCVHFIPNAEAGDPGPRAGMGACWRYPPTAIGLPMPLPPTAIQSPGAPPGAQGAALVTYAIRPPVTVDTTACGEFDLHEEPPSDAA